MSLGSHAVYISTHEAALVASFEKAESIRNNWIVMDLALYYLRLIRWRMGLNLKPGIGLILRKVC